MKRHVSTCCILALLASAGAAAAVPQDFDTPEAAVAALTAALEARDRAAVLAIFGPENEDVISNGDPAEDRELWGQFLRDMQTLTRIDRPEPDRAVLMAGRDLWPFPAEIRRDGNRWSFDAESARIEVLARRIGRNELEIIDIMRRAGEVQAAYRRSDHDGDGIMEFAASILSSPGQRDGLYWPTEPGAEPSPFDETLARASFSGFSEDGQDRAPEPWEGYYFHILQGQGAAAPAGAYSYMVAGNMVAGHALVAYPASYGDTGIMSFMVGEGGIVYQADLGEDTLTRAAAIELFDPGPPWTPVE
ncbi:DUF2950 family protein [Paracoccus benzoatiresistens]|uniref:DUF2950 family protein n=1 Tax=Paracoccus benzoatiresistens TaxID=2997341 RepID=A0ABT4J8P1_9RHOB|nr:DUF2950 family protein [Paracoccus sp. EF6]MCZ0963475.1 DUF2950 family protein [Paracoccus sp. EF6]